MIFSHQEVSFSNVVCKYKDKVTGKQNVNVGDEALSVGQTAANKSAFDSGMFINSDVFEAVLNYVFCKLGIDQELVDHPILMTESLCNSVYSRKIMSELLFEAYSVPKVCYGIDSLFSHYYNQSKSSEGLIVSVGNASISVIPMINNTYHIEKCQRTVFGGSLMAEYMLKLIRYKYPNFSHKIDLSHAEKFISEHCYVPMDYLSEIKGFLNPVVLRQQERIVQFPYSPRVEDTAFEKKKERIAELRREQGRRLKEQAAKSREEKLKTQKHMLQVFKELKQKKKTMSKTEFLECLKDRNFEDEADLDEEISILEASMKKPEENAQKPKFHLVNIPDEDLSEELRKEKRKQKILHASSEARERIKKEKELKKQQELEQSRLEDERRIKDPNGWLDEVREERRRLIEKINNRQKKRALLSDRRSKESRMRMKSIANLVGDESPQGKKNKDKEDTFGANDEDWSVYRKISRDCADSSEEDDFINLSKSEGLLITHDPTFLAEDLFDENSALRNTIIYRLAFDPHSDITDPAVQNQIRLNVERIKIPEIIFEPCFAGVDQAGLIEIILNVLSNFSEEDQLKMSQNLFFTGGFSQINNLQNRVEKFFRENRPSDSKIGIFSAKNPLLDAWKGASRWAHAESEEFSKSCISKSEYKECGHGYLVEHKFSNKWWKAESPYK